MPPGVEVMAIQLTLLCAVHEQLVAKVICTEAVPPSLEKVALVGEIVAGGFNAVKLTVAELLPLAGSRVVAAADAVLSMIAPFVTPQPTVAVIVAVAVAPEASEAKLMVRLLPLPPQVPPLAEQLTKVTVAGKLSVTVIACAASGPLLVTVIV